MSDRPRRWALAIPLVLACLSAGVQGCICYPRTYGCGYENCREECDDDCGPRWGHEHYYEECAAEVREPEYRAPEPPPPPPRHRRPPEG